MASESSESRESRGRVLVATDFSENGERAVAAAIDYARQRGARIDVVHAFHVPLPANQYEVVIPDALVTQVRASAEARLGGVRMKIEEAGVKATCHLAPTPAAGGIVRVAEDIGADVIFVGTRGQTGLAHALLGSVAERVLRHAPCSVYIVK